MITKVGTMARLLSGKRKGRKTCFRNEESVRKMNGFHRKDLFIERRNSIQGIASEATTSTFISDQFIS